MMIHVIITYAFDIDQLNMDDFYSRIEMDADKC